jgi:hypothetical protein
VTDRCSLVYYNPALCLHHTCTQAFRFSIVLSANVVVPPILQIGYAWGTSSDILVNAGADTLANAWSVNTTQPKLLFCYLALNSKSTSFASANGWNDLARAKKTLRATDPRGEQRSTYFLRLSHGWAGPLMLVSGTFHWLRPQSFSPRAARYAGSQESHCGREFKLCLWVPSCQYACVSEVALGFLGGIGAVATRRLPQKIPACWFV